MKLLTVTEAAARLKLSGRRVRVLVETGRFQGAYKAGPLWLIPEKAVEGFQPLPGHRPPKKEAK